MPEQNEKKWILPPNLFKTYLEFISLYNSLHGDNVPILIIGPRGVGKTLFAKTFEKLHKRDHKGAKTSTVNIAAIPDTLIEAELFGYTKGAFTGANSDKKGFIEEAPNGVLILEEIGELKPEVQAKLLTFIEDHKYYRVGDSKRREAKNIQIIATTNKTKGDGVFREDFIDRFFPFYVPPLYERRGDVLYYLAYKFPDIIQKLRPWEILTLLAHNWPGNVREIERVGRVIRWQRAKLESASALKNTKYDSSLYRMPKGYSELADPLSSIERYGMSLSNLKQAGIDTKLLENILNKNKLGLDINNTDTPFKKYEYSHKSNSKNEAEDEKRFDVEICTPVEDFSKVINSMNILFYELFLQGISSEQNMLDIGIRSSTVEDGGLGLRGAYRWINSNNKRIVALIDSTQAYVRRTTAEETKDLNIFDMTKDNLLKYYYKGMLKKAEGNKAKAARLAGMKESTFKNDLIKFGLNTIKE